MIPVSLTWGDIRLAAAVGVERHVRAIHRGRRDHHLASRRVDGWQMDIVGALGELAVAKHFGLFWDGGNPSLDYGGDVSGLHVRTTHHRDGHLIVYRTDPDDAPFMLVCVDLPTVEVVGWLYGSEAKQDRFWNAVAREPCFWVSQSELREPDQVRAFEPLSS